MLLYFLPSEFLFEDAISFFFIPDYNSKFSCYKYLLLITSKLKEHYVVIACTPVYALDSTVLVKYLNLQSESILVIYKYTTCMYE